MKRDNKMTIIELKEFAKKLKASGMIEKDEQVMELITLYPAPLFYTLDIIKIDDYITKHKGVDLRFEGTPKEYILKFYGEDALKAILEAMNI